MQLRVPEHQAFHLVVRHQAEDRMRMRRHFAFEVLQRCPEVFECGREIGIIRGKQSDCRGREPDSAGEAVLQKPPQNESSQKRPEEPVALVAEALECAVDALGEVADDLGERPVAERRTWAGGEALAIVEDLFQRVESNRSVRWGLRRH